MQFDTLQLKNWKKWLVENYCLKIFPGKEGRERTNTRLLNESSSVWKKQEQMYLLLDIFLKSIGYI